MSAILAFDQGTTSSRAVVFDREGEIQGMAQQEFAQHFPKPGWVEHDANEIWATQLMVAKIALERAKVTLENVQAIGIANQRETTIVWDRATGRPIHQAIVWQDRRTSEDCDRLRSEGYGRVINEKTGLVLDAYFCASKIKWLLQEVDGAREKAERGELAFGTVDTWILWNLTKGSVHATDVTNASRTMLWNLKKSCWDHDLLDLFGVPSSMMPEVLPSSADYGKAHSEWFGSEVPITGIAGDQQAALFGQSCTHPGLAKNTYGTGCFALMNIGEQPVLSKSHLLTTATCNQEGSRSFALEGSVFVGGAAVQWLRDGLGIIDSADSIESLAQSVEDTGGVYVVPALTGLGAPHWDSYARGTILGLTRGTTKAHVARATLEGIAFQVSDVFHAMKEDASQTLEELRVDGGASRNNLLMQFQADILQAPVIRSNVTEATALGAAYLAGLKTGFWQDVEEVDSLWKMGRIFEPEMSNSEVEDRRAGWGKAMECARLWAKNG